MHEKAIEFAEKLWDLLVEYQISDPWTGYDGFVFSIGDVCCFIEMSPADARFSPGPNNKRLVLAWANETLLEKELKPPKDTTGSGN